MYSFSYSTLTPRSTPVFRTALKASPPLPPIPKEGGIPRGLSLHRPEGALQSSLSLPSSLTQKCERGLLNGPDRRWRPQCAAAGGDDFAVAQSNKSTYCTHSTARGTGRRLGSQITEKGSGKGERVRNGIPSSSFSYSRTKFFMQSLASYTRVHFRLDLLYINSNPPQCTSFAQKLRA